MGITSMVGVLYSLMRRDSSRLILPCTLNSWVSIGALFPLLIKTTICSFMQYIISHTSVIRCFVKIDLAWISFPETHVQWKLTLRGVNKHRIPLWFEGASWLNGGRKKYKEGRIEFWKLQYGPPLLTRGQQSVRDSCGPQCWVLWSKGRGYRTTIGREPI